MSGRRERTGRARARPSSPAPGIAAMTVVSVLALGACRPGPEHDIVPAPERFAAGGGAFVLDANVGIGLLDPEDTEARAVAELWARPFRAGAGLPLPVGPEGSIRVGVEGSGGAERYRLDVGPDGVRVVGTDHAGLFYGLQTLSQLLPPDAETGGASTPIEVPAVSIDDGPRFGYRGMHLDVARHFFGPDEVKRYLDLLARYKINRFHWHLTEDQG